MNHVILVEGRKPGVNFNAVVAGDRVRFYDTRYPFTDYGQFVSEYFVKTLREDAENLKQFGLALDCGIPEWSVSPRGMQKLFFCMNG